MTRIRDRDKQRVYYANWYRKHGVEHNDLRCANYAIEKPLTSRPSRARLGRRTVKAETKALRRIAVLARKHLRAPGSVHEAAARLLRNARRASREGGYETDLSISWLESAVQKAVDRGLVRARTGRPESASIDQITAGLGYLKCNVQIVPLWYNYAKRMWSDEAVVAAIERWAAARKR